MKQKLLVYHSSIGVTGGVETFSLTFIKKMRKHYDITFLYRIDHGDLSKRLGKYVKVEKYEGQHLITDILLAVSSWGVCCSDTVTAKFKVMMIHGNYSSEHLKDYKPDLIGRYDTFVAVSPSAAQGFKKKYGILPSVIYNLVDIEND